MNNTKNKIAFYTLGCKVNTYETEAMKRLFLEAEYEIVEFSDIADIYIINTCSVTNMADRKSRQILHRAKKNNPNGVVVAVGCYVQAAAEELKKDNTIDVVVGNNLKSTIVECVESYLKEQNKCKNNLEDVSISTEYDPLHIKDAGERTRAFIKIQDGCNQFCSYCIIPYTRGRIRSRNMEDIILEVQELVKKGYKEIVLTGIHLSSYGADVVGKNFVSLKGEPLLKVIEKLHDIDEIKRIRLGSLEPRIITEEFVNKLASYEKICPHFHLSLQSGCDTTLKRMNRHYTTEEYKAGCRILRKYFDHPALTTDVIVGFPEETAEEFEATQAFLKDIAFSQMHIFKFSPRKGTKAANMTEQIPEQIKTKRSNLLLELDETLQKQYEDSFYHKKEKVLFEEIIELEGEKYIVGHNERYIKIAVSYQPHMQENLNEIMEVFVIGQLQEHLLLGKMG
ncbi:MAG: tRNA (N(6)-L-threonylcarbamoyladenosine(37)-C(2))-methylthiotransferase MtaB [Lachnospiraceae bacterium]|nr:tRNA (N(6)-L-threonylcarbamoyladenosine(37)-C(2))-methylthiotransferase MtaB [Lachnospiraceae bacterium]